MPEPAVRYATGDASAEQIFAAVIRALPETSPEPHPQSVREQVLLVLRSAVSIEVLRKFPATDVQDPDARMSLLRQLHHKLTEDCHLVPVTLSDAQAVSLARSSGDKLGRALEDSAGLAAWCLRKEWELARAMGIFSDENDVPYSLPYDEFCRIASRIAGQAVTDEYVRQLCLYPRIIRDVTGQSPVCQTPLFPGLDMSGEMPPPVQLRPRARVPEPEMAAAGDEEPAFRWPRRLSPADESDERLIDEGAIRRERWRRQDEELLVKEEMERVGVRRRNLWRRLNAS